MAKMCTATNARGKPCGNWALPGSAHCRVHQPADPPLAAKGRSTKTGEEPRWKVTREVVLFVLAILGSGLGIFNTFQGHLKTLKDREIEATRLLDQAWDLLGGEPGTESIYDFVKDRKKQEKARRLIRDAFQMVPDSAAANRLEGNYFQARGNYDEAEASFRRAIEIDPDYAAAHNNLGITLADQGRLDEAEASYRRAIEIDPDHAAIHNNLGLILRVQGRFEEAEVSYRRAIGIEPDYAVAHYNLGVILTDQGLFNEAEASFRQATEIERDYVAAHYNLGCTLATQGRHYEAEASFRRAIEIDSDYSAAYYNLAFTLVALGRFGEAATLVTARLPSLPVQFPAPPQGVDINSITFRGSNE